MLTFRSALYNVAFYLNLLFWIVVAIPTLFLPRRFFMRVARLWGLLRPAAQADRRNGCALVGPREAPERGLPHCRQASIDLGNLRAFHGARGPGFRPEKGVDVHPLLRLVFDQGRDASRAARPNGTRIARVSERRRADAIAAGRQLIIFPEGTRRPAGASPDYKSGVAHLYAATGAICVPIALNSGVYWSRRALTRRPGTIKVEILDPIAPGMRPKAFLAELRSRIEEASMRLYDEGRREIAR